MRDGVADVLAQRARLDRGAGVGLAVSIVMHVALTGVAVYATLHATPPKAANMINVQFAPISRSVSAPPAAAKPAAKPIPPPVEAPKAEPKIEPPKPRIDEPKPVATEKPAVVEKNTVPLSPFGKSTKKGSETPPVAKTAAPPATPALPAGATSTADVPVGGIGATGLEGGDFPYTIYIQGMQRRIGTNWFRPQVAAGTAAIIYFRINRDGTITDAKVETSSGNGTFDRAALSSVRSSSPLNPLPFGYNGTYLGVHLTFK
ncbi:MAG: TonB family protein [Acidobacteriota bacterium]|nr:TonB family protein [Acidobacteriota bacterium]